ncbi:MAG TPA: hypothetical protein VNJ04_13795 [Gemmatimonadaceae bacterium]|nr:hypothetical protein [Gemmatimonadaceae bacterium]
MKSLRLLLVAGIAGTLGCAAAPGTTAGTPTRNREIITQEELALSTSTTLYDAIQSLRPAMVRSRGRMSSTVDESNFPRVYVDGQLYGDIGALRNMSVAQVREVRYSSAAEATTRFGTGHPAGVIEVMMKR